MADKDDQVDEEDQDAEGDSEGGGEGDAEGGDGKKSKKKLLFILIPVLLLVGGGAAAYFTGMLDPLLGKAPAEEGEAHTGEGGHGGESNGGGHGGDDGHGGGASSVAFVEVPPILVNLKSDDGVPRNFRLRIVLELANSADKEMVEAVLPRVINEFQIYLRELYVKDLKGSAGIYRLKIELLWRVNQAVEPIEIKDVLFQEILVQ